VNKVDAQLKLIALRSELQFHVQLYTMTNGLCALINADDCTTDSAQA
jgi:hypothetical protein